MSHDAIPLLPDDQHEPLELSGVLGGRLPGRTTSHERHAHEHGNELL
ncbi:hypothetical protein [Myxococcus llanfairpwllgwyngyllgogerychwyrndrobwllllantysiliogogogochensis]|nr:hypothetical protein [Myxococcus llanfairpwllgwyngyllgogerychwyrndrobwllllantysiliogogogochensis]